MSEETKSAQPPAPEVGEVKRWSDLDYNDGEGLSEMLPGRGGEYVLYADHAARVAKLEAEKDALKAKLEKAVTGLKDARCILAVAMKEANRDGAGYHEKAELDTITEIIQACTADGQSIERVEGKP